MQMGDSNDRVVIVGAGLSGLATAIALSQRGRASVILERSGTVGGAAAFSAGQVWIPANHVMLAEGLVDSAEDGATYVSALAHGDTAYLDVDAMRRWLEVAPRAAKYFEDLGVVKWTVIPGYPDYFYPDAPGSLPAGRYITAMTDATALGEWRSRMHLSPHFPVGTTYAELFGVTDAGEAGGAGTSAFGTTMDGTAASDRLTFGPGVVGGFLARAVEDENIELLTGHRVTELLRSDDGVTGVRVEVDGRGAVEFHGPVVVAASGFDWDPELVERFWGLQRGELRLDRSGHDRRRWPAAVRGGGRCDRGDATRSHPNGAGLSGRPPPDPLQGCDGALHAAHVHRQ